MTAPTFETVLAHIRQARDDDVDKRLHAAMSATAIIPTQRPQEDS